jgi:hypothetical protein
MNLVSLKNVGVTDPGDPVGVKKALVEAVEVVVAEGNLLLKFLFFCTVYIEFGCGISKTVGLNKQGL